MAVTEESRHDLHTYFQETMGRERATTMMELLPPVGWGDIATKQDLRFLSKDIEHVRDTLSKDIESLRASTTQDIKNVRDTLSKDIENLRIAGEGDTSELRAEFHNVMRIHLGTTVGAFVGISGLALTAAKMMF